MTAFADADGVYIDAESRAGVEPIDQLLAERDSVVTELAPLWAEYGPGGLGEHRLSAKRCEIVELLRATAAGEERKVTESSLETGSRAHKTYLDFIAKQTTERVDFFAKQERLRAIDFRLNRGQALIRAYASEPK